MSIIVEEIGRIQGAASVIKQKAYDMGIAAQSDKLNVVATALHDKVTPYGTANTPKTVNSGTTVETIPAGSYLKGPINIKSATVSDLGATLKESKTATPTTSDQTINPSSGKLLSYVLVKGVSVSLPDAGNILTGSSATVTSNGTTLGSVSGTMANQGAKTSTLTYQGAKYTIPAGYHNGNGVITASLEYGEIGATATGHAAAITAQDGSTLLVHDTAATGDYALKVKSSGAYVEYDAHVNVDGYVDSSINDTSVLTENVADTDKTFYVTKATVTPTTGTLTTSMETVLTGGYAVQAGTSKVVVGAGYTEGTTKDVTPATIRVKGSTTTHTTTKADSAPASATNTIQPKESITISKGYVQNDIVIYADKADDASEAVTVGTQSVSIIDSDAGVTPVLHAGKDHYDIKKDISVSVSVASDGWWAGSKTATASNVTIGSIPKLTYSVTGDAPTSSVSTAPTASASITACSAVKTASSGPFYLTYSASANSGVATANIPAQTVTLTAGYSAGDTVTIDATSATSTAKTASKSGITYLQAGIISASASVTDVTLKKVAGTTLPVNDSKDSDDYILKVGKNDGGALTYSGSVLTEGYVNSTKNTANLSGTAANVTDKEFYVSKGVLSADWDADEYPSVSIKSGTEIAWLSELGSQAASDYYSMEIENHSPVIYGEATVSKAGYIPEGSTATTDSISLPFADDSLNTIYIPKATIGAGIKSTTNATVKVDTTKSTVSTHSNEATGDYKLTIVQNAAGTATPQATTIEGYVKNSTVNGTASNVGVSTLTTYVSKGTIGASASVTPITLAKDSSSKLPVSDLKPSGIAGVDYYNLKVVKNGGGALTYSASVTGEGYIKTTGSNTGDLTGTAATVTAGEWYVDKAGAVVDCSVSSGSASLDMGGISTHPTQASGDFAIVLSTIAGSATGSATVDKSGYVEKLATPITTTKSVSVTGGKTVYVSKATASKTSMSFSDDGGSDSVTISAGYNPSTITITGSCSINRITETWIDNNLFA